MANYNYHNQPTHHIQTVQTLGNVNQKSQYEETSADINNNGNSIFKSKFFLGNKKKIILKSKISN